MWGEGELDLEHRAGQLDLEDLEMWAEGELDLEHRLQTRHIR
jgi:hypothetical protein